jgi:hypothetical protein
MKFYRYFVSSCLALLLTGSGYAADATSYGELYAGDAGPGVESMIGQYVGENNSQSECQVNISLDRRGIFRTPYMIINVENREVTAKVSKVESEIANLEKLGSVRLSNSIPQSGLRTYESSINLFFEGVDLSGLHFQAATFSLSGIISGKWDVLDCSRLVKQ